MGCGGSRSSRLVSPLSKAVISWNGTTQQPTALHLKDRLRFQSTKDAAIQVGVAPILLDKLIQTDAVHFTEDDLETLLEEEDEPEITDVETQTFPTSHPSGSDNVKSVLMQTDSEKVGSVKFLSSMYDQLPAFVDIFDEETFYVFVIFFTLGSFLVAFILSRFITIKPVE